MVTEKELKNFILKESLSYAGASVLYFTMECLDYYKVFGDKSVFLWLCIIVLIALIVYSVVSSNKTKARYRRFMPYLLKKTDTVEKLKSERTLYNILFFVLYCSGSVLELIFLPLVCSGISSVSFIFLCFSSLTTQKIRYLEEKPEGL